VLFEFKNFILRKIKWYCEEYVGVVYRWRILARQKLGAPLALND